MSRKQKDESMSVDFDAIEGNKFWKGMVQSVLVAIVAIVAIIHAYYAWETDRMITAGYEYRRVPASTQTSASYNYQWIKIGSQEHTESKTFNAPERTFQNN